MDKKIEKILSIVESRKVNENINDDDWYVYDPKKRVALQQFSPSPSKMRSSTDHDAHVPDHIKTELNKLRAKHGDHLRADKGMSVKYKVDESVVEADRSEYSANSYMAHKSSTASAPKKFRLVNKSTGATRGVFNSHAEAMQAHSKHPMRGSLRVESVDEMEESAEARMQGGRKMVSAEAAIKHAREIAHARKPGSKPTIADVMAAHKKLSSGVSETVDESVKPGEVHHIDWDGKSKVYVDKVVGNDVHLTRLNRPMVGRNQPVRPEDKIVMSKKEFHSSKLKSVDERHLTPAELKKREEIAKAIERENPGIDMDKKMAIATAAAKKASDESIDELSNDLLGRYKKAAAADSSKADASGDFKRGDKRFAGIMKATKKEFKNTSSSLKESFAVLDNNGKVVDTKFVESDAKKKAEELTKSTGKQHTHKYIRTANIKEDTEGKDTVTFDVPALIRALEWAREEAQDDVEIHDFVEDLLDCECTIDMSYFDDQEDDTNESVKRVSPSYTNRYLPNHEKHSETTEKISGQPHVSPLKLHSRNKEGTEAMCHKDGKNYSAVKSSNGKWYLNGDYTHVDEDVVPSADRKIDKNGRPYPAHRIQVGTSVTNEALQEKPGSHVWIKHPTDKSKTMTGKVVAQIGDKIVVRHKDGNIAKYHKDQVSSNFEKLNPPSTEH